MSGATIVVMISFHTTRCTTVFDITPDVNAHAEFTFYLNIEIVPILGFAQRSCAVGHIVN